MGRIEFWKSSVGISQLEVIFYDYFFMIRRIWSRSFPKFTPSFRYGPETSTTSRNLRCISTLSRRFLAQQYRRSSVAATESVQISRERQRFRRPTILRMAAQLAKPFTVYVIPEDQESPDAKRRFRMIFRYPVQTTAAAESTEDSILLNFERDFDGILKDTLTRIRMKLTSVHDRKSGSKKRKKTKISDPTAEGDDQTQTDWILRILTATGSQLDEQVSNEMAFITHGRTLVINNQSCAIFGPAPAITKLEVDVVPMVGYPVLASVNVTKDTSIQNCQYFWFCRDDSNDSGGVSAESLQFSCDHDELNGAVNIRRVKGFTLRCTDQIFVPNEADVGRQICLVVTPGNANGNFGLPRVWTPPAEKSSQSESLKNGVVVAPLSPMIWTERHLQCSDWTSGKTFRCLSYNILADLYLNLALPDEQLYYPYCPKRYQARSYRYPLLLEEISGYRADLCCLQEVDTRNYVRYLRPYLASHGWRGISKRKGGVVNEGSAIFYRPEKFELIESNDEVLSNLLSNDNVEFADLTRVAKQSDSVWNTFLTRPAIVQVAVFRCNTTPNSFICVGNTHLHFKPHHSHIRLLQAAVAYRHLLNVAMKIQNQEVNSTVAVVFCGDFNSTRTSGVYEMFENGRLHAGHSDWQPQADQEDSESEQDSNEPVQGIDLQFTRSLTNACPSIEYTTITDKFRGLLDYIFISSELEVERVIPMPDESLVTKHTGLPSLICPSDHLPVICELKFR